MRKIVLILGMLSLVTGILAKDFTPQVPVSAPAEYTENNENYFSVGVGGLAATKVYKQKDSDALLYPSLDTRYGRLYIEGIQLGVYLYESDRISFSLFVDPNGGLSLNNNDMESGYKNIDDRDSMVMGGGKIQFGELPGDIEVVLSYKGGKEGQQADLVTLRSFPITPKLAFIPSANASMFSSDYTDYYFGVSKKEVNRSSTDKLDKTYNGDTAYSYGAKLSLEYMFNESIAFGVAVGVVQFSGEIKDSPIVENETIFYGGLEAKYIF